MSRNFGSDLAVSGVKFLQGSPKIHPCGVKHESVGKSLNIRKKYISLYMFHPSTPTPTRGARPRVYARGGVKG